MRRRAELHLDVGQRELEEEMGVLAGLSTADGLFDVELKGKDRPTDTGGVSSSIKGLKLFQRSSQFYMVSAFFPLYFHFFTTFRGWFMKPTERDLKTSIGWDNRCCSLDSPDSCPTSLSCGSPAYVGGACCVFRPLVHVSMIK